MSTPGNTAKLGTAHSNIQTAQRGPSLVGSEPTMHSSAHYWVSALSTVPAWHKIISILYYNIYNIILYYTLILYNTLGLNHTIISHVSIISKAILCNFHRILLLPPVNPGQRVCLPMSFSLCSEQRCPMNGLEYRYRVFFIPTIVTPYSLACPDGYARQKFRLKIRRDHWKKFLWAPRLWVSRR